MAPPPPAPHKLKKTGGRGKGGKIKIKYLCNAKMAKLQRSIINKTEFLKINLLSYFQIQHKFYNDKEI